MLFQVMKMFFLNDLVNYNNAVILYLEDAAFLHSIRLSEQVEVCASDFNVLHTADERASDNLPPAKIQKNVAFKDKNKEIFKQSDEALGGRSHLIGREAGNPPM